MSTLKLCLIVAATTIAAFTVAIVASIATGY